MSLNRCTFLGNLGQDVDLRYLPDGKAVANLSIACSERWTDKNTNEKRENTEWIRAVCFNRRAEVIAEHFKKGSQIYIEGKMRTRKYDKNGVDHWSTEIVVDNFQFLGQKAGTGDAKVQQQASAYGQNTRSAPQHEAPPTNAYQGSASSYDDYDDDIPFN